jgi:hypothetical protein
MTPPTVGFVKLLARELAYVLTLFAGVAVWVCAEQVTRAVRARRRRPHVDPTVVPSPVPLA